MSNSRSVTVSAIKSGVQIFSFSENTREPDKDCGFIHTNLMILKDIFHEDELISVLKFCEREYKESTNIFRHCAVSNDQTLKNNISTCTDGVTLNCLHP
jgi:hypothetical protein